MKEKKGEVHKNGIKEETLNTIFMLRFIFNLIGQHAK